MPLVWKPFSRVDLEPQWDTASYTASSLLRLPPELILMILEYLPPSAVLQFFLVSKRALLYADMFCAQNPHYFYRCCDPCDDTIDKRHLMIALAAKLSYSKYRELDMRWEVVSRIAHIAGLISLVPEDPTHTHTSNPRAPLQPVGHQFGLCEIILRVPDHVEAIDVWAMNLEGRHYVCGLGIQSISKYSVYGNKTGLLHRTNFPNGLIDSIGFATDALGIRCIQWSGSRNGGLDGAECWEGLSLKRESQEIRIIHDVSILEILVVRQTYLKRRHSNFDP